MTGERFGYIKAMCDTFDDLPDGAFLCVLSEHGIDTDDLYEYSKELDRRKGLSSPPKQRKKNRRRR